MLHNNNIETNSYQDLSRTREEKNYDKMLSLPHKCSHVPRLENQNMSSASSKAES